MTEQLISFETAKLAKEKGYRNNRYQSEDLQKFTTQSLLQKWLRDNYNIHIFVEPFEDDTFEYTIISDRFEEDSDMDDYNFESYEEALEVALIDGLKLLQDA